MANMTGMHNQTKISVPGNQMFITFESNSTIFTKKGFEAFINEIGMYWSLLELQLSILISFKTWFLFFLLNVEDNCKNWLNLKDMRLKSPNYPKWYFADGMGCDWLLTAPEDHIIALEFNDFEVITIPSLYIF